MQYLKQNLQNLGIEISYSLFEGDVSEAHALLLVEPRGEMFMSQLERLFEAIQSLPSLTGMEGMQTVFARWFLSDAANQTELLTAKIAKEDLPLLPANMAHSIIQQPPLDGSKVALWLYMQRGSEVLYSAGQTMTQHHGYRHFYDMDMQIPEGDSYSQTKTLLDDYEQKLQQRGLTLADNCIRTWFFVRDVDIQYKGMVVARRENFVEQGLTQETHYIASTGIGGVPSLQQSIIQLGCYALQGHEASQVKHLYAPSHLNPTHEYGVTFERGTSLQYGDRKHLYISGTASINNRGEVVHVGDIASQTRRMWENVATLLTEGGASIDNDVMQMIVYLRDMGDFQMVKNMFEERFPDIPTVITLAPVCRPAWLIEMECIAVSPQTNGKFRAF